MKEDLPPQDVGAADGTEGPEEASGSRSNKELRKRKNKAETRMTVKFDPSTFAEVETHE